MLVLCHSPSGLRQHAKCKLERRQSVMPGGKAVDDLKPKSMTAQSLYSFHEKVSKRMQMNGRSSYMQMDKASQRRNHPICLGNLREGDRLFDSIREEMDIYEQERGNERS